MDAVLIEAPTQSDVRFLMDFAKRISAPARALSAENLEDTVFLSLMEEAYNSERVSREEVMKSLKT